MIPAVDSRANTSPPGKLLVASVIAVLLAACASGPRAVPELDGARVAYDRVAADPLAREAAAQRLDQAQSEIRRTAELNEKKEPIELVRHHAYLARRYVEIAEQQVGERRARQAVDQGRASRDRVLLEARSAEVTRARTDADQAREAADAARARAQSATADADKLRAEMSALQAQQTDRGMVLTLGDVLFDTGRAELQPGAFETLERLATFLRANEAFQVIIEGHTDSQGSSEYNLRLSERRAQAVRSALTGRGIAGTRVRARGLGLDRPVASNGDAGGRQRNRRVEIVFSDANGEFSPAASR